jgi:hypothetical protein
VTQHEETSPVPLQDDLPLNQATTNEQTREEEVVDFSTEAPNISTPHVIEDDEGRLVAKTPSAELLRWHYRLGHLSFNKLRLLALLKILPSNLATVKPPKCSGCIFGSMTKRPWRTKGKQNEGVLQTVTQSGECI